MSLPSSLVAGRVRTGGVAHHLGDLPVGRQVSTKSISGSGIKTKTYAATLGNQPTLYTVKIYSNSIIINHGNPKSYGVGVEDKRQ